MEFMLAGIKNAMPVPPEMGAKLGLSVVTNLRGRWKRNVDGYRFVYEHYWNRMNHHIPSWEHPLAGNRRARDYMVEFNIFTFWVLSLGDGGMCDDPATEEAFVNELLAGAPNNGGGRLCRRGVPDTDHHFARRRLEQRE
jgi:hypothetical protein